MQAIDTQGKQRKSQVSGDNAFLVIEEVSKVYPTPTGSYTVLENVNLTVNKGEFICVIGHSGCGKSTLLNMVSGFATPSTGSVRLNGTPIKKPGPDRMVVFQNYALLPWLTVFVSLSMPSILRKWKPKKERLCAKTWLW
jgi:bicarbonate transport system ATP-binding protein